MFLVDLGCLGIKSVNLYPAASHGELLGLRDRVFPAHRPGGPCAPELAVKVLRAAERYAGDLGFQPAREMAAARPFLEGIDAGACDEEIPVGGLDGKPFFFAGPYDDVDRIMATLTQRLGPDGFHFTAGVPPG